ELISLLATGAGAVERDATVRRFATALGWGAFAATLLMAIVLRVRPDIAEAARLPMLWIKLAFPGSLVAGSLVAATRLSRPGVRLGQVPGALLTPVLAMGLLAAIALSAATPAERADLIMGSTAKACLLSIPMLSLPLLVAALWAMKGLAPTRLALAGGAIGLLAGSLGALIYALHCPEMAAPFITLWYTTGMLIPTAVGALL